MRGIKGRVDKERELLVLEYSEEKRKISEDGRRREKGFDWSERDELTITWEWSQTESVGRVRVSVGVGVRGGNDAWFWDQVFDYLFRFFFGAFRLEKVGGHVVAFNLKRERPERI